MDTNRSVKKGHAMYSMRNVCPFLSVSAPSGGDIPLLNSLMSSVSNIIDYNTLNPVIR